MKVRKNLRCQLTTGGLLLRLQCMLGAPIHPCKSFVFVSQHDCVVTDPSLSGMAVTRGGGGALGYFLGGYLPPGTPNWHPVLKKIPPKTDTRSTNGPIFYTPF